jgi:hypothetical protein
MCYWERASPGDDHADESNGCVEVCKLQPHAILYVFARDLKAARQESPRACPSGRSDWQRLFANTDNRTTFLAWIIWYKFLSWFRRDQDIERHSLG